MSPCYPIPGVGFVCTPTYTRVWIERRDCPTCGKSRFFVCAHAEWYGIEETCLRCGERWADGERCERPFAPRWRQESVRAIKRFYRRQAAVRAAEEGR